MNFFKSLFFLVCCSLFFYSAYCQEQKPSISIEGKASNELVQLYRIDQGEKKLVKEFSIREGETVIFNDSCEQAFYLVSHAENTYKKIYVRKGQSILLNVLDSLLVDPKPTKENALLEKWAVLSSRAKRLSVDYYKDKSGDVIRIAPFYEAQRQLEKDTASYLKEVRAFKEDSYFTESMPVLVDADINFFKLFHRQIPLIATRIKELPEDLYGGIRKENRLANSLLLNVFEYTIEYVYLFGAFNQMYDRTQGKPTVLYATSSDIQVAFLLYMARTKKDRSGLKSIEISYMHLFESGYAREQLEQVKKDFDFMAEQAKLNKITLKTPEGEIVKLSDYCNGKMLVVDVWATWCGPCKVARPSFDKLAQEMKEQVSFVAISIDKSEMAWQKFVSKSELTELLDNERLFANGYGISSVPCVLIFDKDGELLDAPAPSPINGRLKQRLEELLVQ